MLTHKDDGPSFGLGWSDYSPFHWHLSVGGCLLSWSIMDIRNWPTELALSKSILIRGLTFMPWPYCRPAFFIQVPVQVIWSALSTNSRILFKWALKIDLFFCLTIKSESWPAQFSCFPMASMYLTYILWALESILLWNLPQVSVRLGRVRWNTIWMVGWALSPSLILGWYWAFCVLMFLSGLVPLCSWIHFALLCTQGFAIPAH